MCWAFSGLVRGALGRTLGVIMTAGVLLNDVSRYLYSVRAQRELESMVIRLL